jgi:hypothetical protein
MEIEMIPYEYQLSNSIHHERLQEAAVRRHFARFGSTAGKSVKKTNRFRNAIQTIGQKLSLF